MIEQKPLVKADDELSFPPNGKVPPRSPDGCEATVESVISRAPERTLKGGDLTKEESVKERSDYLRGGLAAELAAETDHFEGDSTLLLKFHGMYQQDDRDLRVKTAEGIQKKYSLMIRGRIPGGRLTTQQYLMWDHVASVYGSDSIRLTTRQSIQLHGVLKGNVKKTLQAIHDALLTTTGACGDVVRNVTQAVNPLGDPALSQLDGVSQQLSDYFKAGSSAYAEIFLDDERQNFETTVLEGHEENDEPIYGKTYLPRKFKIGVTLAGNNSIDIYTNDMGFAATIDAKGVIDGFFVFAGGGLGMTHNKPATFPRAADLLGWIPAPDLLPVAEAIVTVYRDVGDRSDRKHARLKYVLADHGVDWFRQKVEKRLGFEFQQRTLPPWNTPGYLGWHKRLDGTWSLGFHILAGRIADWPAQPLKSVLRDVIEKYQLAIQLTADQDLILLNIPEADKADLDVYFSAHNISLDKGGSPSPLYNRAMACPALPTCGLAITEAERYFPDFLKTVQDVIDELDLNDRAPVIRMTGCPNGCARPYSAELGLVGRTVGAYALYIGGDLEGTRVARQFRDNIPVEELGQVLYDLFNFWKKTGHPGERFGEFTHRIPLDVILNEYGSFTPHPTLPLKGGGEILF